MVSEILVCRTVGLPIFHCNFRMIIKIDDTC
jgi:hypothetical protein